MLPTRKIIVATMMCALGASTLLVGCGDKTQKSTGAMQMPPAQVTFLTVKSQDLSLDTILAGRTSAYCEAEVRPQVNGILEKRLFKEGAQVKAGEALYKINASSYQAALKSAEASLAQARATLVKATADAKRSAELLKVNAVSKQADDAAQAALKAGRAAVKAGEAAVANAKINLEYTNVRSPISGRIGRSEFTEGALMGAYQVQPLTKVQQLDPIYVDITQTADELLRIQRDVAAGQLKTDDAGNARVRLQYSDGTFYEHEGKLTFTDVAVNESTGSVNIRAVFPNPDWALLPGLFVRATVIEGVRPNALSVPMQALMRDTRGTPYVYVITADNKIERRIVQASRTVGTNWLIDAGLKTGERVVLEGFQRVRPGATVTPVEADPAILNANGKPLF